MGLIQENLISDHLTYKWSMFGSRSSAPFQEAPFALSAEIIMYRV